MAKTAFEQTDYTSLPGGHAKTYYAEISGADMMKVLSVGTWVDTLSSEGSGAKVTIALEQSVDGRAWATVETLHTITSTGGHVANSTKDFADRARLAMRVEEDNGAPTHTEYANLEVVYSGKPF